MIYSIPCTGHKWKGIGQKIWRHVTSSWRTQKDKHSPRWEIRALNPVWLWEETPENSMQSPRWKTQETKQTSFTLDTSNVENRANSSTYPPTHRQGGLHDTCKTSEREVSTLHIIVFSSLVIFAGPDVCAVPCTGQETFSSNVCLEKY